MYRRHDLCEVLAEVGTVPGYVLMISARDHGVWAVFHLEKYFIANGEEAEKIQPMIQDLTELLERNGGLFVAELEQARGDWLKFTREHTPPL